MKSNKCTILISVFLCIVLYQTKAQTSTYTPFPVDSFQWNVFYRLESGWTDSLFSNGLVNVNGKQYIRISNVHNYSSSIFLLRDDTVERKVYFKNIYPNYYTHLDTAEILMYDFSLQIGDTFNLKLYCGSVWQNFPIILVDTFTSNIIGTPRKCYKYSYDSYIVNNFFWGVYGLTEFPSGYLYFMEGVGAFPSGGFNYLIHSICPWTETLCLYEKGSLIYYKPVYHTCNYYHSSINENEVDKNNIKAYPNPANNQLIIETRTAIKKLSIYNLLGTIVYQETNLNTSKTQINVETLKKGVYILQVEDAEEKNILKFVRQ